MRIAGVEVEDTFAEAFPMKGARVIVTAANERWALEAARSFTGFATSVIGCKCEAGLERPLPARETPDGRPGVSLLLFAFDTESVGKRLLERVGQCVLTCPTTACYDGLPAAQRRVNVGGRLRVFGDRHQASKMIDGRRYWRVPVMEGEFLVQESFGVEAGVGGGNFLVLAETVERALAACEAAVEAIRAVRDVILPFPGGVVRSGSKVGSSYEGLPASTNEAYCPTLRAAVETRLPPDVGSVLEVVIDGFTEAAVAEAMRVGVRAAARPGVRAITAGNYGGKLGKFHFRLHELLESFPDPS
ncbi:MAG: formylmethanofuran--tetrahydromethanopterin N-formyltransferase [Gemmatimonadetes bacterium]|nr:formylmethanofuran--tetrahydromethanopterin N-formyltransferase [Gemmatimonadota bacterium]